MSTHLSALAAIVAAHFLPGLLLVKLLDLGRDLEERWVLALVLGGPLASLYYFSYLVSGSPLVYFGMVTMTGIGAMVVPWRTRAPLGVPLSARLILGSILSGILVAYYATTGSLYRVGAEGAFLMDRALQRDVLYHVAVVRTLTTSYPPELLSAGGQPIGYHVGYHLQVAAWARFFGVDPFDGLIRLGPGLYIGLLLASAYLLARRFTESERAHLLSVVLVLCSGWGFLAFSSVDFWSLAFMDVTLVSVFLTNPLLPALPLLFAGLALLGDYLEGGGRGLLVAGGFSLSSLLTVKLFLGAQAIASLGLAALLGWGGRRMRTAFAVACTFAVAPSVHTLLAARGSNTSVTLRPLEIVRYSMEKIGFELPIPSLVAVGRFEAVESFSAVAMALAIWLVGFLGLRLFGLREWAGDLWQGKPLRRTIAWFALMGFSLVLLFRIAPAEAEGLSRLEAQNDVVWFGSQAGIVLWFWTASFLARRSLAVVVASVGLLALPATVQHFAHAATLSPDLIGASRLEAAERAADLSTRESVWLAPADRSVPSMLPYFAGRRVVYDPYVGYDYMFVGRDDLDYRRHAVAQFFHGSDFGYRAWFLAHFGVDFIWQEPLGETWPWSETLYENDDVRLMRIRRELLRSAISDPIVTPTEIYMGGRGAPYLGRGFARSRDPRVRMLSPGTARLYLPRERGETLRMTFRLSVPHATGVMVTDSTAVEVSESLSRLEIALPAAAFRGLHEIVLEWRGRGALPIEAIVLHSGS
ncbi:MAG TPA: hypothetical protein VEK15_02790 [Vicinamibacteria bacterium]|nr:hypothetical protein [Vicinamibacteria bacterium]